MRGLVVQGSSILFAIILATVIIEYSHIIHVLIRVFRGYEV